ncbi:hypothetical protein [Desulfoplanes sp.]
MEPALVAALTGFAGQSHLTKTFKRFAGTTPARFRERVFGTKRDREFSLPEMNPAAEQVTAI